MHALADARNHPDAVAFFTRLGTDDHLHLFRVLLSVVQYGNRRGQHLPDRFFIGNIHGQGPVVQRLVLSPTGTGMRRRKAVLRLFPEIFRQRLRCRHGVRIFLLQNLQRETDRFGKRPVLTGQRQNQLMVSRFHLGLETGLSRSGGNVLPVQRISFPVRLQQQGTALRCIETDQDRIAFFNRLILCGDSNQAGDHPADCDRCFRSLPVHPDRQEPVSFRYRDSFAGTIPVHGIVPRTDRPFFGNGQLGARFIPQPDAAGPVFRNHKRDDDRTPGTDLLPGRVNAQAGSLTQSDPRHQHQQHDRCYSQSLHRSS